MIWLPKYVICAKMKTLLVVVLCLFVRNLPLTRGVDICPTSSTVVDIKDTDVGVNILNLTVPDSAKYVGFEVQDTTSVSVDAAATYFEFNIANSIFTMATKETFKNLGLDADGPVVVITIFVTLSCDGGSAQLPVIVKVTDTFSNDPEFSQASYEYSVPMPIMPRTDITWYGGEISVLDINFSNTGITLTISPEDFDLTLSTTDNKNYKAVFSAKSILQFTENQTYTLTATDTGGKTSNVQITIAVDPVAGLDTPSFTKPYYSYDYSNKDSGSITPKDGEIVIKTEKQDEALYELDGASVSNFEIQFDNNTNTFKLSLKTALSSGVSSPIVLSLSFTTDATTNTILLINILNEDVIPKFSSDYYVGTYDADTNVISWTQDVSVTDAADVELAEGKSSLFTIDKTSYDITPNKPLEKTDFDDNLNIIFEVVATSSSTNTARSLVVISLKTEEELKFDNAYYGAEYSVQDGKGTVSLGSDIGFSGITDLTGIDIKVDDSYKDNFKIAVDESSKWTITVSTLLNDTILSKNSELPIPIFATKEGLESQASAVLILTLPEQVEIKFDSSYYTASYVLGTDSDSVQLEQAITVTGAKSDDIKITVAGYEDTFEVTWNADTSLYQIIVKADLDKTILDSEAFLPLNLTASSLKSAGSAVVILQLPETTTEFQFKKNHYRATYEVNAEANDTVTLQDGGIEITGAEDVDLQFSYEGFGDNFALKYDTGSSSYVIDVLTNLNASVIESNTELIITITAAAKDGSYSSNTVLVLALPQEVFSFKFLKSHYSAAYTIDADSKGVVTLNDGSIEITDADGVELEFSYEGFEENFKLNYDTETSSYGIDVLKNLNASELESKTDLVITITASTTDKTYASNTVLILTLPQEVLSFKFGKNHYSAKYTIGTDSEGVVTLNDGPIEITDADDIELVFSYEGFEENFELKYNTKTSSYGIDVLKNLNSSELESNTDLIITITASTNDKAYASNTVLILALPEEDVSFKFGKNHYSAKYTIGTDSKDVVTLNDGPIEITDADGVVLEFSYEGFDDNFKLNYDTKTSSYEIDVSQNLNSSIFQSNTELVMTITASTEDGSYSSNTVLILTLPQDDLSFKFGKNHYSAAYTIDADSKGVVTLSDGPIEIIDADDVELEFSYEGFEDNFKLTYDTKTSSYGIDVQQNLNSSVFQSNTELVITITAFAKDDVYASNTVLILSLPQNSSSSFKFGKNHYSAAYTIDADSKGVVTLSDGPIEIIDADDVELEFSYEGFEDNFKLSYDTETSSYGIDVQQNLNSSVFQSNTELVITITAFAKDDVYASNTVLILSLPQNSSSSFKFGKNHYSAAYTIDADSKGVVTLSDGPIEIIDADDVELEFSYEGFEDNFKLTYDTKTSSYGIDVQQNLNSSIFQSNTELVITITAFAKDDVYASNTVLILSLPQNSSSTFKFGKNHYSAAYTIDADSKGVVTLSDGPIEIIDADDVELEFSYEGFEDNFKLTYDTKTSSYGIDVQQNLNSSIFQSNTELVITITAFAKDDVYASNTVLILSLPQNSSSSFKFGKNHYSAAYTIDADSKGVVTLSDGPIEIIDADDVELEFSYEGFEDNFKLTYDTKTSSYGIDVQQNLNSSVFQSNTELVITITAFAKDDVYASNTVLILSLPQNSSSTFKFGKNHYSAAYTIDADSKGVVTLSDGPIEIIDADDVELEFSYEGFEDNFKLSYDTKTSSYGIDVQQNLNSSVFQSNTELVITITAFAKDDVYASNTVLILSLPQNSSSSFKFGKNHYSAAYTIDADSKGVVTLSDGPIEIIDADDVELEFSYEGFEDNFKLTYDTKTSSYGIDVQQNLNSSVFQSNTELVITITAFAKDDVYASNTVLIISLPQNSSSSFKFGKNHYSAAYTIDANSKGVVTLSDGPIEIIDADDVELEFSYEGFEDNFKLTYDTKTSSYGIDVQQNLNSSVFQSNTELVITITAFAKDDVYASNTVLILSLPQNSSSSFKFGKNHYSAAYTIDADSKGVVTLSDGPIEIIDADDVELEFSYEGFEDNFKLSYDTETSSYGIDVQQNLNSSVFQSNTELVITITAFAKDDVYASNTVLILSLPQNSSSTFKFGKNHYSAAYTIDAESQGVVTLSDGPIEIIDADNVELEFSYEGFEDNFKLTYDTKTSSYGIDVQQNLNSSIFQSNTELVITITAFAKDDVYASNTVLILSLPQNSSSSFKFGKNHYSAAYTIDADSKGVVTLSDGPIEIIDADDVELEFSYEGFEDNFKLTYDTKTSSYGIDVQQNLNSSVFQSNTELVITITAFAKDDVYASNTVLILSLPQNSSSSFKFGKNHYSAAYTIDADSKGVVTLSDGPIEIIDADDVELEFSYEGFEDNFKLTYDTKTSSYGIDVQQNLNSSVFQSNTELVITITAFAKDDVYASNTVLIISLPQNSSSSFKFGKNHYSAAYTIDANSKGVVTLSDGPIEIIDADDVELEFSYEGFEDNFKLTYDTKTSSYGIDVQQNLNSSVFQSNTELVITITAFAKDDVYASNTVLIISLPQNSSSSFKFGKNHYSAAYTIDANSKGVVTLSDGPIEIIDADDVELEFSYEGFEDNFKLTYDTKTSSYGIDVQQNLNSSVFQSNTELVITITAFAKDDVYASNTVLILSLPQNSSSSFKFGKNHYSAAYTIDAESQGVVTLSDGPIEIIDADNVELEFSYEGFEDNFKLGYDTKTSSYGIDVQQNLNSSVFQSNTELVITITAFAKDDVYASNTVLILSLPQNSSSSFKFGKNHYSAAYTIVAESQGVVTLSDGPIEIIDDDDVELAFSYEGYEKFFDLIKDESGTYSIKVLQNLNDSVLESSTQLIITIVASAAEAGPFAETVLILDLPADERSLAFEENYYEAVYRTDSDSNVQLDELIVLKNEGYESVQVSFGDFDDNFELVSDSSASDSYQIKTKKPIDDTILSLDTQLTIVITASDVDTGAIASTVLLVKLPSYDSNVFESNHYVAEYLSNTDSDTDGVNVIDSKIKVKTADYSLINVAGYQQNFEGTCDSTTLECAIKVKVNLNSSVLAASDELLLTLIGSNKDQSRSGRAVLLLNLPRKTSTFSFTQQHYGASYSIQKSDDEKASIQLNDIIYVQGVEPKNVSIALDQYKDYFSITYDSSSWMVNLLKNLDTSILKDSTQLVTSLTATNLAHEDSDYARSALIIKLPDSTSVAFTQPQYNGEYVIEDPSNPTVVLDSDSQIEISDLDNTLIVLDSYSDNFAIELGSDSKWSVRVTTPLTPTVLSQYSELKLLLTITKIGVSYGTAGLTVRLPSLSFSKDLYSGSYSVDDDDVGSVTDIEISIDNVDPSLVQIELTTDYSENFYAELVKDKWTIKVKKSLSPTITGKLVINLHAVRKSDSKLLATSTLEITIPSENGADTPKFFHSSFSGTYRNWDSPVVELSEPIKFADDNPVEISSIDIDATDEYSTNFTVSPGENDEYLITVDDPLSQDVIENVTNIVLTLVAKSKEGNRGLATLVISMPKAVRNPSVQVEDKEVLFTGTYENGEFQSPSITLDTNSTDDDDISVTITNELGIDDSYFTPTYSNKVLTIKVGELPDEVLNNTAVIPLKLAITDRTTQDTTYAVLNIAIVGNSDNNGGGGGDSDDSDPDRVGLIVAVSILAFLLVLVLLAAFLFWYFKLRSRGYAEMSNEEVTEVNKPTTFTKNEIKKPPTTLSSSSLRRPTGIPIGITNMVPEESSTDQEILVSLDSPPPSEFERKVDFDDAVATIDPEDDNDYDEISSEGLQSVADRRPTKFVFGYPLEAALLDNQDQRRESSDYTVNPDERDSIPKKSVAFDENVERLHIDPVEDGDDADEAGNEDDDNAKEKETSPNEGADQFKTETEIEVKGGDEQLPSHIFKEIF